MRLKYQLAAWEARRHAVDTLTEAQIIVIG
jgi:hypothetical protein